MATHILLRELDTPDIHKMDVYLKHGGYEGLKKAVAMKPAEVIDEVKASNLRGRGGAGFPTGVKWSFIPQTEPLKYVVVNADESETGTFKDRQIMENNPHQLIEGAMIAAWAIQATAVYIYLRGEYWDIAHALDKCIAEAEKKGFVGKNVLKSGWDCPMYTHLGAGAYICGEESALLESLEGKLGQPRVRPPFPAQKGGGLYAEATVVNNVETLANVPWIMVNGAAEFKKIGTEQSTGTKVFCLSGHVKKPGNYEAPLGALTLRQLIFDEAYGGGVPGDKKVKAILPSGGSGPIIPATDEVLDLPLTYEDMQKVGTILGSASIIIMDEDTDITWVAAKVTQFFRHESCGKCTPCRIGTTQILEELNKLITRSAVPGDLEHLEKLCIMVKKTSLCGLGQSAPNAVLSTLKHFRHEYETLLQGEPSVDASAGGD